MSSTAEQSKTSRQEHLARLMCRPSTLWILLGLVVLGVLVGHQTLGVIDRDEARFAQASKQMLASGDYITPYFMDELRAKKPIMIYWLQSASAALFAENDIASYRLPSLAGLIASLLLVYRFSRSLWPSTTTSMQPLLCVLLLASSLLVLVEAHLAKTDSVLLCVLIAQQFMLWRIYRSRLRDGSASFWFWFWLFMSLGILLKGPIAPLLALTSCIVLVLMDKRIGWLKGLHLFKGLIVVGCMVLPWVVAVTSATEGTFLDAAIRSDLLPKIQSGQESHGAPPGTYLALLGLLFWPGIAFLGPVVRLGRQLWNEDACRFCLAWLVGYWLVIEFVPTKLPHYILPALPALVLLCGHALNHAMSASAKPLSWFCDLMFGFAGLFGVLFGGGLIWASLRFGGTIGGSSFVLAILVSVLICVCTWRLWCWHRHRQLGDLLLVLCGGILIHILVIAGVVASASSIHVSARLADEVHQISSRPTVISLAGYHEPSAAFHLGRDVLLLDGKESALFLADGADGLAVVEKAALGSFLDTAGQLGLELTNKGRVTGFNISKGRNIELFLYQRVS